MLLRSVFPRSTNTSAERFPPFIVNVGVLALKRIQLIGKNLESQEFFAFRKAGEGRGPWYKPLGRLTQT